MKSLEGVGGGQTPLRVLLPANSPRHLGRKMVVTQSKGGKKEEWWWKMTQFRGKRVVWLNLVSS